MNINNISAVPPRSFSTKLSPKEISDIDLSLYSEDKNNIYSTAKEQSKPSKAKKVKIDFNSYIQSYRAKNRKIDPDSILDNITAIHTSNDDSFCDIDTNTNLIKHISYDINEFTEEERELYNQYGDDISIKKLLNEIMIRNAKINEMEKEIDNMNSCTTRCDSERKYLDVVKELNEIKSDYQKDKEKLLQEKEDILNENETLKKEKNRIIEEIIREKGKMNNIVKQYEDNIKKIQESVKTFKTIWSNSK